MDDSFDDDYMSDAFVTSSAAHAGHVDPRFELPSWKRKAEVEKKTQETLEEQREHSKKRIREMEKEVRAKGLSEPLSKGNKGFEMLKKMGFSEGSGEALTYLCLHV